MKVNAIGLGLNAVGLGIFENITNTFWSYQGALEDTREAIEQRRYLQGFIAGYLMQQNENII